LSTYSISSLVPKTDFLGLEEVTYLASGLASPPLLKLEDAFIGYLQDRKRGLVAKVYYDSIADQTRSELATMLGCQQSEIAFVGNVSQGMNLLADAVKLNGGDDVVTEDAEYR